MDVSKLTNLMLIAAVDPLASCRLGIRASTLLGEEGGERGVHLDVLSVGILGFDLRLSITQPLRSSLLKHRIVSCMRTSVPHTPDMSAI